MVKNKKLLLWSRNHDQSQCKSGYGCHFLPVCKHDTVNVKVNVCE